MSAESSFTERLLNWLNYQNYQNFFQIRVYCFSLWGWGYLRPGNNLNLVNHHTEAVPRVKKLAATLQIGGCESSLGCVCHHAR